MSLPYHNYSVYRNQYLSCLHQVNYWWLNSPALPCKDMCIPFPSHIKYPRLSILFYLLFLKILTWPATNGIFPMLARICWGETFVVVTGLGSCLLDFVFLLVLLLLVDVFSASNSILFVSATVCNWKRRRKADSQADTFDFKIKCIKYYHD